MLRSVIVAALLLTPAAAMAQSNAPMWQQVKPAAPAAPGGAPAAASASSGKVLEAQNAGGYTYLRVDAGGSEQWIAVPEMQAPVGATVQWSPGAVMQNFQSKSLGRTFPRILFSGGAQVVR